MNKEKILNLFDNYKFKDVYDLTNPYKLGIISDFQILYFLKSKLALDDFQIKDNIEIKKLFFYYFYIIGKVEFDNNYSFSFNKNLIDLSFNDFENDIEKLKNFKQYFNFGKNEVFLSKIIDKTINIKQKEINKGAKEVNSILDFFMIFTFECSELYSFSGEHFPLFKWLINKIS